MRDLLVVESQHVHDWTFGVVGQRARRVRRDERVRLRIVCQPPPDELAIGGDVVARDPASGLRVEALGDEAVSDQEGREERAAKRIGRESVEPADRQKPEERHDDDQEAVGREVVAAHSDDVDEMDDDQREQEPAA